MLRRWLIRLPFILALTFVVGMWATSYFGSLNVLGHTPKGFLEGEAAQGLVALEEGHLPWVKETNDFHFTCLFSRGLGGLETTMESTTFGFHFGPAPAVPSSLKIVFPLWLPTLLLAGLNWIICRKTRTKPSGSAFPIERSATPK